MNTQWLATHIQADDKSGDFFQPEKHFWNIKALHFFLKQGWYT